ncbi:MAG: ABC transporter ATP-binding protein [Sphaerochaetaceae bacterium]|nr:ABC transporter ATP-binding protein [Sphaerochaetaceae bacterium]MDC7238296.1 ABC transporter ATP-binding protein [Sphaerochaetaceae bacterium]MDC7249235.1 ABC transporter ATP-binding protein [Sphaerochaetaceae bacterium]
MKLLINNLKFSYPNKTILKNINCSLDESQIMCVVGPNGSGKSTLVKCIEGLLHFQEGSILLGNVDMRSMSAKEIAKNIGYVPQSTRQLFSSTVFDTILMGRKPYYSWAPSEEDLDLVIDVITKMDLENIAFEDFNKLSGGQQQRVLIARALAQQPKILLLDEPTSALDISHQLEVMEIIHELSHKNKIQVFMVIHDLNLAARYADKILMLKAGQIYAIGSANEVLTQNNIEEVYGVESKITICDDCLSVIPVKRIDKSRKEFKFNFL